MAQNLVTTSITPEVSTYYEKVFLARAEYEHLLAQGSQSRTHPQNEGKTVNFTRYEPMTVITTALGESSNPTVCLITACTVPVTLQEYGLTINVSKLLSLVSIDRNMKEKVELMGQNQGETLNRLTRDLALACGTQYMPNAATTCDAAAGDIFGASCIREITKTLEIAKAMPYSDGMFLGKTVPQNKYTLLGDDTWINAKQYSDIKGLYKGEMGELYQVRWLLNKDVASENGDSSTAACAIVLYHSYIHGRDAFGTYDLTGDKPRLFFANGIDSGNPAGRITKVSWAGTYAAIVLRSEWVSLMKAADA